LTQEKGNLVSVTGVPLICQEWRRTAVVFLEKKEPGYPAMRAKAKRTERDELEEERGHLLRRPAHKRACIGLIAEVDVLTDARLDGEYNAHQAAKECPRMPLYPIRSLPNSIRNADHSGKKIKSSVRLVSRAMTAEGCLALALMFLSPEAEVKLLGVLFGLLEQRALKYIKMSISLSKKVRGHSALAVFSPAFCGTVFIC
jgi:hypothetical protein